MFGFLSRLFGGKSTVIKDPDIGKIRYLESEHGHVWAGTFRLRSAIQARLANGADKLSLSGAEVPALSGAEVQFFIASKEMVLRHESKNSILDVQDHYEDHINQIEKKLIEDHPLLAGKEVALQFLHIPEPEANYSTEFICGLDEQSFSAIFDEMKLQELILHED